MSDRMMINLAVNLQSEPAASIAFEAWFARERGDLERARLLAQAAVRAHRPHVQRRCSCVPDCPDVEAARRVIERARDAVRGLS